MNMPSPKDPAKREEWRRNISKSTSGEKHWMFGKHGSETPMFGKHHTKEAREKNAAAHRGKNSRPGYRPSIETRKKLSESLRGENCHFWKGGVSFGKYCQKFSREFKNRVRAFFGYKCVECGKTREELGISLDVHHVNYDKMMCCNDVKPLFVALCRAHNAMANTNREFWEDWYTEIINEFYGGHCYLPKE